MGRNPNLTQLSTVFLSVVKQHLDSFVQSKNPTYEADYRQLAGTGAFQSAVEQAVQDVGEGHWVLVQMEEVEWYEYDRFCASLLTLMVERNIFNA